MATMEGLGRKAEELGKRAKRDAAWGTLAGGAALAAGMLLAVAGVPAVAVGAIIAVAGAGLSAAALADKLKNERSLHIIRSSSYHHRVAMLQWRGLVGTDADINH